MTSITPQEAQAVADEADVLYTPQQVDRALDNMAAAITGVLAERNPIVLTVMTGGLIFAGRLLPRLLFPLQVDYLHATRYRGATSGGELQWIAHPSLTLKDRCVLVLDDILDEGLTLEAIVQACRNEGASEVYSAVLVKKRHDRCLETVAADFVGLEVEDRYVFGCGMDYHGYLRNLPGIYAVRGS